ncbi:MAG: hypothetical protein ACRDKL_00555, partial [Solirubrobacteraceae bacterium]
LTEAEAQLAAIASFGSVRAVVRAHAAARHGAAIAALTEVVLAGWQLVTVYLLADFAIGLAWQLIGGRVIGLIWGVATPVAGATHQLQVHPVVCASCGPIPSDTAGLYSYPTIFVWAGAGAVGVTLLGGLALIRYWQRRSGRVRPRLLGSYAPIPGAIVMFFLAALIVYAWKRSDAPAYGLPDVGVALIASVCSAAYYLVAWGRALHRRPRPVVVPA